MEMKPTIESILGELAGSASLCWDERPYGRFDATQANKFVAQATIAIKEYYLGLLPKYRFAPDYKVGMTSEELKYAKGWNACINSIASRLEMRDNIENGKGVGNGK